MPLVLMIAMVLLMVLMIAMVLLMVLMMGMQIETSKQSTGCLRRRQAWVRTPSPRPTYLQGHHHHPVHQGHHHHRQSILEMHPQMLLLEAPVSLKPRKIEGNMIHCNLLVPPPACRACFSTHCTVYNAS